MTKDEALRLALEALEHTESRFHTIAWGREQDAITAIKAALEAKDEPVAIYGYCPTCNAKGLSRERHPDGSDVCTNGHIYQSKYALTAPRQQEKNEFNPDWDTQAVLTEEIQRMAKRIEELEAKGEPVAVWELFEDGWDSIADPEWMESLPVGTKLYTIPPQRKPLTDETRNWIVATCPTPRHIIDAVERMHGIKGEA